MIKSKKSQSSIHDYSMKRRLHTPPPSLLPPGQPKRASSYIPSKQRNPTTNSVQLPPQKPKRTVRRKDSTLCANALSITCTSSKNCSKRASEDLEIVSELKLPPILTKPLKKEEDSKTPIRRIRVRRSSPRIGGCRTRQRRRALSESLVVIKSSSNPGRDFMESMVEMVVENDIRDVKDMEELLTCYLSLNNKEYHDVIIKVFEHIWMVLANVGI
ncbi:transcription repressor OFP1-like [Canna indica]|uniref:Transcription repressor n=1 Tax=Canna indica TaxID=4628 RepID=A0AAQ3Q261_9LILI|nr:transcription repressor OFP1-like [Canna indica]